MSKTKATQASGQNKIYEQIKAQIGEYVRVENAEEEICELYSVYYCNKDRVDRVNSKKTELDIEIKGQTGGVLWNSSVIMSEYFAQRSAWAGDGRLDVGQANVVELGSGCGLVGLALHQLGARRVALTDQQRMLRVLNKNIEACRVEPKYKKKRNESEQVVYATEYLWGGLPEDMQIVSEPVDLVVASDCVYHEGVVALLVQTLGALCRSRADGAPTVVVVGQELRSDLVHQAFVEGLLSTFVVHRMPVSESVDGAFALYVAWLKGVDLLS